MARVAAQISLSDRQRRLLEKVVRADRTPQQLARRGRAILLAATGKTNIEIAQELGTEQQQPGRWRKRWSKAQSQIDAVDNGSAKDKELTAKMLEVLTDRYRSGAKGKFSAEQLAQIIAIACEKPEACGYPISHWTPKEIASEAVQRGVVESISVRHVGRFLKRGESSTSQNTILAYLTG